MNRFRPALGAVLLVIAASVARADEPTTHERAARELFQLVMGDRMVHDLVDAMMTSVRGNEQVRPYESVVKEWVTKLMSSPEFESKFVAIYVEVFSEEELRELTTFYRSPVGKKAMTEMPRLMAKGLQISSDLIREHRAELEEMIAKRKKEMEGEGKNP